MDFDCKTLRRMEQVRFTLDLEVYQNSIIQYKEAAYFQRYDQLEKQREARYISFQLLL